MTDNADGGGVLKHARRDLYPPISNEPRLVLITAACEALLPVVNDLRRRGWAVGVTAHTDGPKVTLDIDLSGLKVPVEAAEGVKDE